MVYAIHWEDGGIRTVWTGRVTSGQILEFQRAVQSDARFDDICYSLHDFRGCTEVAYSRDDMFEAAAIDRAGSLSNPREIRIAVVAGDPKVVEMIKSYLDAEESPYPLRFFGGMDDAEQWVRAPVGRHIR